MVDERTEAADEPIDQAEAEQIIARLNELLQDRRMREPTLRTLRSLLRLVDKVAQQPDGSVEDSDL
jgi:hypothetical protein